MYKYSRNLRVTRNNMGVSTTKPNEAAEKFIQWAEICQGQLLDIGAAYGIATIPALEKGAQVIAADLSKEHLAILLEECPEKIRHNLTLQTGNLPYTLNFKSSSLDGILVSNVLHFLRGKEIEKSIQLMHQWLKPGGKIFVIAGTPYEGLFDNLIPFYQKNKDSNVQWPGELENIGDWSKHPIIQDVPPFYHVLEDTILQRSFEKAGFIIEKCTMFTPEYIPEDFKLDNREAVLLIGQKSIH